MKSFHADPQDGNETFTVLMKRGGQWAPIKVCYVRVPLYMKESAEPKPLHLDNYSIQEEGDMYIVQLGETLYKVPKDLLLRFMAAKDLEKCYGYTLTYVPPSYLHRLDKRPETP